MTNQTNPTTKTAFKITPVKAIFSGLLLLGVIIHLFIMGCEVSSLGGSVWTSASLWIKRLDYTSAICMVFILLFAVNFAASATGVFLSLFKNKTPIFPFGVGLFVHAVLLVLNSLFDLLGTLGSFAIILALVLYAVGTVYGIVCQISTARQTNTALDHSSLRRSAILSLGAVSMFLTLSLFFIPFCSYWVGEELFSMIPLGVFTSGKSNDTLLIIFAALFAACAVSFAYLLNSFTSYASSEGEYAAKVQKVIGLNTVIAGGYFVAGVAFCSVRNQSGKEYTTESYMPFLLAVAVAVIFAFVIRAVKQTSIGLPEKTAVHTRIEFFIYGLLAAGVTVAASLSDILRVSFTKPANLEVMKLNGLNVLKNFNNVSSGFQLLAFLLLIILTVTVSLFILSLVSLISRSKLFYKITLAEILCGAVFTLLVGLFGKYYEIVQQMNEGIIRSWIDYVIDTDQIKLTYKITSQSFYWLFAMLAIIALALIRKPYTKGTMSEALIAVNPALPGEEKTDEASELPAEPIHASPIKADEDPCPAFTELDRKALHYIGKAKEAARFSFESPTLPALVEFVVSYARNSRLHLSYTAEDIAAFVAGLGATKLTILQGMSGTGKTSLPKIFTEAIMGKCEIVEVESSWRDKHELLGYYNEFSSTYTPKKFTQALYKAVLNPDQVTFIVLDEMNLSRIEYYFSDFLSLMENEADKREIKLLNKGLYRTVNGEKTPYIGLTHGHTIKIPSNVWFVGTANRDESTFEISDKVYDRAHTMNFNNRAPKVHTYRDPIERRYLSVGELNKLLEEAKQTVHFDIESSAVVAQVENLLAPYNISFGNRVANQIETFVSIYSACFTPSEAIIHEALETILLSKVVSKLEFKSVENKAYLAAEFRRLNLNRCSEFVSKLNED